MAGPRKRRTLEENEESSSSEGESENMEVDGTIQADFEGRNPDAADFHGIQQLLKQLFLKAHVNLSQLSDMIISQQGIGSVLKQSMDDDDEADDDDDEDTNPNDVFGVTTILNLTANKENECVTQLLSTIKTLASKHAVKSVADQLDTVLSTDKKKIGLLLNERFINIPAKIADPLLDSLLTEIDRIAKKNPSYKFDYLIMICKTYQPNKDKKDEITFVNAEEEIIANASEFSFEFSVANEMDTGVGGLWTEDDKPMIPHRRVLVIDAKKFPTIVASVKQFVA